MQAAPEELAHNCVSLHQNRKVAGLGYVKQTKIDAKVQTQEFDV